jgi:hypothetical protein
VAPPAPEAPIRRIHVTKKAAKTKKRPAGSIHVENEMRVALGELKRHERLLREISRQTKRVERMREKAKSDLLDFGIRLANQAGWHVTKSEPVASQDRTM